MNIKVVVVGSLQTNCYILEKNYDVLIIDPGDNADLIISNIESNKRVVGVVTTHSHDDHVGAVAEMYNKYKCTIYNYYNLSEGVNRIGAFKFNVIRTEGHMNDAITLYFEEEKIMFVGDFIFKGSIGRTDMPGSSALDMKKSISKILEYPKDITLLPGHGPMTTLQDEVNNLNYFLKTL